MSILLFIAMVAVVVLCLIGGGIALIIAFMGGLLTLAGIVTSTVAVAVTRRSIRAGVVVLTTELGFIAGAILGALIAAIWNYSMHPQAMDGWWIFRNAAASGLAMGALGCLVGLMWYHLALTGWNKVCELRKSRENRGSLQQFS